LVDAGVGPVIAEELTDQYRAAIQAGLESLEKHGPISMEEVLADFGLTMADFEKTATVPYATCEG
jgi:predicted transcriptional regulator